ncbi:MAG: magnesium and cobalt exporter, family [Abditibacteriota bacterium]|nr:magnesium and cobalt exporter, family [Abditibacteriota bacterium]
MGSIATEAVLVLVLILANGVFALAEVAIVASRKARLQQSAQAGSSKARVALELAESPNTFLATVQIGITMVGILAGAFGGATLSKSIAESARTVPFLAPYADSIGLGIVVLAITYLSLVIGELVPKRIGLQNPEGIATLVAVPMRWLSIVASPIVKVLSFSTDVIIRLFGLRPSDEPPVTEDEIRVMMETGTQAGVFEVVEQDMIGRVFRLGDRAVSSLMTHRPEIVWLDLEDSFEQNQSKLRNSVYSRVPVCRGDLENVIGILRAKDMLNRTLENEALDFTLGLQTPVFVPETLPALKLLETLKIARAHIALVIDEHGTVQGLVTLHDILGAIVGDLPSVDESDESYAVQREDGSWLLDGMLSIEEFRSIFDLSALPGEEAGNFQTLSGFVMMHMGRVPHGAEHFEAAGLRFEIIDMDGHRIDKILVSRTDATTPQSTSSTS